MGKHEPLTEYQLSRIKKGLAAGKLPPAIGRELGLQSQRVRYHAKRRGWEIPSTSTVSEQQEARIKEGLEAGLNGKELAAELGLKAQVVIYTAKKRGWWEGRKAIQEEVLPERVCPCGCGLTLVRRDNEDFSNWKGRTYYDWQHQVRAVQRIAVAKRGKRKAEKVAELEERQCSACLKPLTIYPGESLKNFEIRRKCRGCRKPKRGKRKKTSTVKPEPVVSVAWAPKPAPSKPAKIAYHCSKCGSRGVSTSGKCLYCKTVGVQGGANA